MIYKFSWFLHFCLVEFPAPKNELVQRFQVRYLGNVAVAKPVGKEHFILLAVLLVLMLLLALGK